MFYDEKSQSSVQILSLADTNGNIILMSSLMDSPFTIITPITDSYVTDICWDQSGSLMLYSTFDGHLMFSYFDSLPKLLPEESVQSFIKEVYGSVIVEYLRINDAYAQARANELKSSIQLISTSNDSSKQTQFESLTTEGGEKKKVIKPQLIQKYQPYTNLYPENPFSLFKEYRKTLLTLSFPSVGIPPEVHIEKKEVKEVKEEKKSKQKKVEVEEHHSAPPNPPPIEVSVSTDDFQHISSKCDGNHCYQYMLSDDITLILTACYKNLVSFLEWKDSHNKVVATYRIPKEKVLHIKFNKLFSIAYTTDSAIYIFTSEGIYISTYKVAPVSLISLTDNSQLMTLTYEGILKIYNLIEKKVAKAIKVSYLLTNSKTEAKITEIFMLNNEIHITVNNSIVYKYDSEFEEFKKCYDSQLSLQTYSDKASLLLSKLYHAGATITQGIFDERNKFSANDLDQIDNQFLEEKLKLLEEHNMINEYIELIRQYMLKLMESQNTQKITTICRYLIKDSKTEVLKQCVMPMLQESKNESVRVIADYIHNAINSIN